MTSSGIAAEIKSRLPVIDVVGETVVLKRAGSAYKGLCPFHAEKTPSFIVTPDRESWRCFGCGEGGDIFTFLMRRDGIDFREALSRLAEKAGVELSAQTAKEDRHRRRLREALEAAIAWYREVLLQAPQAEKARAYLDERGLTAETLERFGIGYAPTTWDALTRRLVGRGFTNDELVAAGLASPSNRGGVIDKFRGRIIIPIRDASGRAVGLGGRIMPGADGPKYLNSPAGPLFDKSRTLYGLDLAKAAIRREKLTVIVEGYTDVMAAHQAGFANVVASMGTGLTRGQVEQALKYADAIALAYDIDLAGEAATQRGLLEELGPEHVRKVRVMRIPTGKDPDELIRSDPEAWRRIQAEAQEKNRLLMDYFIEKETVGVERMSVADRLIAADNVLRQLARVRDPLWQGTYVQELAQRLRLDEKDLRQRLAATSIPNKSIPVGPEFSPITIEPSDVSLLEMEALRLLMRYPGLAKDLAQKEATLFRSAAASNLASAWRDYVVAEGSTSELGSFVSKLDPATGELARQILVALKTGTAGDVPDPQVAPKTLPLVFLRLRAARIEEAIRDGQQLLAEAQPDDGSELETLKQQINQLGREKADLNKAMESPAQAAGVRRN